MKTATRHPQTGFTRDEAAATVKAARKAPPEELFRVAAATKVDLHGLSVERPMTLTMGGTGSRKNCEMFIEELSRIFTVAESRTAFDLIGRKCNVTFTLDFGATGN